MMIGLNGLLNGLLNKRQIRFDLFFPWEEAVIRRLRDALPPSDATCLEQQLKCLRLVQRHGNGQEVNTYRDWLWRAYASSRFTFQSDSEEALLARGVIDRGGEVLGFKVFCVKGVMFSVEFDRVPGQIFKSWDESADVIASTIKIEILPQD